MWQHIIIWTIIGFSAFYFGRRIYRQWRAAVSPGRDISCGGGCSCCSAAGCDDKDRKIHGV